MRAAPCNCIHLKTVEILGTKRGDKYVKTRRNQSYDIVQDTSTIVYINMYINI
jgi:hypothetical protein